jgi:hypothetical protein
MKEIVELSTKTVTIDRNEFLKVKGSIDTNILCGKWKFENFCSR